MSTLSGVCSLPSLAALSSLLPINEKSGFGQAARTLRESSQGAVDTFECGIERGSGSHNNSVGGATRHLGYLADGTHYTLRLDNKFGTP